MKTFLMVMAALLMLCTVGVSDGTTKKCIAAEFISVMAVLIIMCFRYRL